MLIHDVICDHVLEAKKFSEFDRFYSYFCDHIDEFDVVILDRFIHKYDVVKENFVKHARENGYKGKLVLLSAIAKFSDSIESEAEYNFDLTIQKSNETDWGAILAQLTNSV